MTLGIQLSLLFSWHEYVDSVMRCMAMYKSPQVYLSVHKMTLELSMPENIFLLHIKL